MEDFLFHRQFDGIGQLEAVRAEELDAVVAPGIVGGGDDYAGLKSVGAGEEGYGRGGHDAGAFNACSGWRRPAAKMAAIQGLDSRVSRPSRTAGSAQVLRREWARATPSGEDGDGIERGFSGDGADAVGTEETAQAGSGHRLNSLRISKNILILFIV